MDPQLIGIMIGASLVVGLLGRNYRFGFWGYFFSSMLLTPMIGLLLVIASRPMRSTASRPVGQKINAKTRR